ncbi:hypothetical protein [Streptomyces sp. NPDC001508]|uniref:hypothetical protein n=1 Tax=Streptomyces sp. NPDC001508 TaxID=3154656 RepID=UPI00331D698A
MFDSLAKSTHYTEALRAVVEAKQEGHRLPEAPVPGPPGQLADLMAALKESVDKARSARGEDDADIHQEPDPAEKATGRKTAKAGPATEASPGQP